MHLRGFSRSKVGIVVGERIVQLKYRIPTPSEFYETFCKRLRNSTLPHWNKSEPWTKLVLDRLLQGMGKELGFEPVPEYLRIDQTWSMSVEGHVNVIEVAIEHEANADWERVMYDEGSKLMDVKARLKVLIFYPELPQFEMFTRRFSSEIRVQELKLVQERYLTIGVCRDNDKRHLVVKGVEISPDGSVSPLSDVEIPYSQF
jgi:hypothetical protein